MVLIIGGTYHGKKEFLLKYYHSDEIFDCKQDDLATINNYQVLYNIHTLPIPLLTHIKANYKIVVGDEIGLGIVPIESELRIKRDAVGRLYQELSKESTVVIRIWYGIAIYIKGTKADLERIVKNG